MRAAITEAQADLTHQAVGRLRDLREQALDRLSQILAGSNSATSVLRAAELVLRHASVADNAWAVDQLVAQSHEIAAIQAKLDRPVNEPLGPRMRLTGESLVALQQALWERTEDQAIARWRTGERNWEDLRILGGPLVEEWRESLIALIPRAVMLRTSETFKFPTDYLEASAQVIARVPDAPSCRECSEFVEQSRTAWKSADEVESLAWARVRLTLGKDRGVKLRRRCWTRIGAGWQLTQGVGQTVRRVGDTANRDALNLLMGSRLGGVDQPLGRWVVTSRGFVMWDEEA